jgi:thiol-disulfide isomerase/thioredoxin
MNKRIHRLLLLTGVALVGCQSQQPVSSQSPPSQSAPSQPGDSGEQASPSAAKVEIIQVDFAGFEQQVKKLAGKFVVVDVWSTGCPPCMKEYTNLVALSQRWPSEVICVSYNVDYIGQKSKPVESYLPKVGGFLEKQASTRVINLMSTEADSDVFDKLEIASIPVVMLFDREGRVVKKFTEANSGEDGLTYEADIIPAIEEAMKAK